MTVMIGVDPHKRSHTAVAIDSGEVELAAIEVRASHAQVAQLLAWAAGFEARTWAVEGAGGVGYLLAQQLVASGIPECCGGALASGSVCTVRLCRSTAYRRAVQTGMAAR